MVSKDTIKEIIADQSRYFVSDLMIKREINIPLGDKRVIIVTGVRRSGKSMLIRKSFQEDGMYLNFEDPRLVSFDVSDFPKLEDLQEELGYKVMLLDELQWVEGWEIFARSLHEKGKHLYITGSNASMLSRELGTRLTGRYKQIELFPFSYLEFLDLKQMTPGKDSFESYFELGGFPEYLQHQDPEYLRTLLRDIITRDVAVRRNILNEMQLVRLGVFLCSNIGKELSYNRMGQLLEIKSVRTVIDYCDYLEESYLFDLIPLYATSIRKQIANPKKIYAIDPALAVANSISFTKDLGRRLENFVYLQLRRSFTEIYYFKTSSGECDFLVKWNEVIIAAVQVCWKVDEENLQREIKGIEEAKKAGNLIKSCIVTFDQEDIIGGVELIPFWKWAQEKADKWLGLA
ncbi:ATP-binding protein [Aquiflexum sp.]|uniref:ATP-binding protein n=1 Tax=Aquiflexum sp. TaxID=1872584 RepID=UPI003593C0F0